MFKFTPKLVKKVITKDKKMSNNSGSCKIAKFEPSTKTDEKLQAFADDFFEVTSIDYQDDGTEQLVGYLRQDAKEEDLQKAANKENITLPPYTWHLLQSDDWLTENIITFSPLEEAEFFICSINDKTLFPKNKIGLKVYAATAFGSEHQTTRACLDAISDINNLCTQKPQKILDVGTGSGILALAAAKIWTGAQVIAVDIDDEAVRVAEQNALDNGVEKQITASLSDGYQSDLVRQNAPYDVIFANILARPLIAMASDMVKSLKKGGYAVISGFIDEQTDWVVGEHEKNGLKLVKLYQKENWRAALLEK